MSLTTFLTGKKQKEREFQEIIKKIQPSKLELKTLSNKLAFSEEFILKSPNNLTIKSDSMIVGTTFDYLARFRVAQKIETDECCRRLVAENFFMRFVLDSQTRKVLKEKFDRGINYVKEFVYSNNYIDHKLIDYAYFFGRLEQCWRGGRLIERIEELLDSPNKEIEEDLINLMNVFDDSFLNRVVSKKSNVIFNPQFGVCASAVRGADADIFIDGVLYDFKTTKYYSYNPKDIQQIIAYYLFSRINTKMYDTRSSFVSRDYDCTNIDRVSIYLARYGEINYLDMNLVKAELIEKSIEDLLILLKDNIISSSQNFIIREYFKDKSISKYTEIINDIKYNKLLDLRRKEELAKLKQKKQEKEEQRVQSLKFRQDEIVIITENGSTFHTNEKCWALRNSKVTEKITIRDAINKGKEKECKLCY